VGVRTLSASSWRLRPRQPTGFCNLGSSSTTGGLGFSGICAGIPGSSARTRRCWRCCAGAPPTNSGQSETALGRFLQWLAAGQLLAGALDFVENWAMRHMIVEGTAREPWPQVSATASGIKWLLLLAFVFFALWAAGDWLVEHWKGRS
jgi:hypothetical protein